MATASEAHASRIALRASLLSAQGEQAAAVAALRALIEKLTADIAATVCVCVGVWVYVCVCGCVY